MSPPLLGLVLAGGRSTRMGTDKGSLSYLPDGEDQRSRCARLLSAHCDEVFISCRASQVEVLAPGLRALVDSPSLGDVGPAAGLVTAHRERPSAAWLVVAVDFPWLDEAALSELVAARDGASHATCFVHPDGTAEPLLTVWEPTGLAALAASPGQGARRVLESSPHVRLRPSHARVLVNVNTPADLPADAWPPRNPRRAT